MKSNNIVDAYNLIDEENRLNSSLARKVEYLSTIDILDKYIKCNMKVLDCGCGVGIYSTYLANKNVSVNAVDLVPEHISKLNIISSQNNLNIDARIGDSCDLSCFHDNYFDVVLCLGPIYHLIDKKKQEKCIEECIRVCKNNGIIMFAYLSLYSIFPCVIRGNKDRISDKLYNSIIDNKVINHNDDICFWTDMSFHTSWDMKKLLAKYSVDIIDNLATDGQSIMFQDVINNMNDREFDVWLRYHKKICRDDAIIDTSNHSLMVVRKKAK